MSDLTKEKRLDPKEYARRCKAMDKQMKTEEDARRYRRLRVLGCAVMDTPQLTQGTVSRFTNLDEIVDADMQAHPERGE